MEWEEWEISYMKKLKIQVYKVNSSLQVFENAMIWQ